MEFNGRKMLPGVKRLVLVLCLLCGISLHAAASDDIQVFDVDFGNEKVCFQLRDLDEIKLALFADTGRLEIDAVVCAPDEYGQLKKIAYESKVLVKSVESHTQYESSKIYQEIVNKFKSFAPIVKEDYMDFEDFGFIKISFFFTKSVYDKHKDEFEEGFANGGLSGLGPKGSPKKLTVWSFTDELEDLTEKYYKPAHPKMEIEYKGIPTDQFPDALESQLVKDSGTPDVFALETAFVRRFVESGLLLPLDDIYKEIKDKMDDYPMQVAKYNGHVYAMSWQTYPGAMFYRRSLAKKYLGTDDPKEVQKYFCDLDTFIDTARIIRRKSYGSCRITVSPEDLFLAYKGARKNPWIVNDKLTIDPAMSSYMEAYKIMRDENLTAGAYQWSEEWFLGMNDRLFDPIGDNPIDIFCYMLPPWGLDYVLKLNGTYTSGDWAMCEGPSSWYWGGTWIAASKKTKNAKQAKEMIKYLVSDDEYLTKYAKSTGDIVGNINVQKKVKDSFAEPYLSGQNPYEKFAAISKKINGSLDQSSDQMIESIFREAVMQYADGEKSKKKALRDFAKQVEMQLGIRSN